MGNASRPNTFSLSTASAARTASSRSLAIGRGDPHSRAGSASYTCHVSPTTPIISPLSVEKLSFVRATPPSRPSSRWWGSAIVSSSPSPCASNAKESVARSPSAVACTEHPVGTLEAYASSTPAVSAVTIAARSTPSYGWTKRTVGPSTVTSTGAFAYTTQVCPLARSNWRRAAVTVLAASGGWPLKLRMGEVPKVSWGVIFV